MYVSVGRGESVHLHRSIQFLRSPWTFRSVNLPNSDISGCHDRSGEVRQPGGDPSQRICRGSVLTGWTLCPWQGECRQRQMQMQMQREMPSCVLYSTVCPDCTELWVLAIHNISSHRKTYLQCSTSCIASASASSSPPRHQGPQRESRSRVQHTDRSASIVHLSLTYSYRQGRGAESRPFGTSTPPGGCSFCLLLVLLLLVALATEPPVQQERESPRSRTRSIALSPTGNPKHPCHARLARNRTALRRHLHAMRQVRSSALRGRRLWHPAPFLWVTCWVQVQSVGFA
jgi:hypothetical protein